MSFGLDVRFILLEKTLQTFQMGSTSCLKSSFTSFSALVLTYLQVRQFTPSSKEAFSVAASAECVH